VSVILVKIANIHDVHQHREYIFGMGYNIRKGYPKHPGGWVKRMIL
jgi:hypothetical protein